jgi:hypothetical protein
MSETTESPQAGLVQALSVTEAGELKMLEADSLSFFRHGAFLRLTIRDQRSYPRVTVARAFPLSLPKVYYSVRDVKNNEVGMIADPDQLSTENRALVEDEIRRRYMVSTIKRVLKATDRFGTVEWQVETDRGMCSFTTRELRENVLSNRPGHYLITDVENNRFEIPSLADLDTRSREFLDRRL